MFPSIHTPAALVDVRAFESNVRRGAGRATELATALRPHAKTVKSPVLLRQVITAGAAGLTVSTMEEVRSLKIIASDLLYGVPVAAGKPAALGEALGDSDVRLTVILDSPAGLDGVPSDPRVDVAIEVDCDGHRGGIAPHDPELVELAERIAERHLLRGVMTHGGGSYLVGPEALASVASAERDAVVAAARRLREAGHACDMVSVGSTPTFAAVDHLEGVTETRPGVYLFGDLSIVALGGCEASDLALSVLATVIGLARGGDMALVDAGWSALSQDRGAPALGLGAGFGRATTAGMSPLESELVVSGVNQEHGFVTRLRGGSTRLSVGDRIRVWPNHACATAEMHQRMVLVADDDVEGQVDRPRGW